MEAPQTVERTRGDARDVTTVNLASTVNQTDQCCPMIPKNVMVKVLGVVDGVSRIGHQFRLVTFFQLGVGGLNVV